MSEDTKCLIVEDSPTQSVALEELLVRNGYDVRSAGNGREALEILGGFTPDVIISDVVMPEMDGFELCRRVKSDPNLRGISVLLLTTLSEPQDVFEALQCGADNFLTKPADERQLLFRLQYLAANRSVEEDDSLRAGIEINFVGRRQFVTAPRLQILNMLLSSYDIAIQKSRELEKATAALKEMNEQLETKVEDRTRELRQEVERRQLLTIAMEQSVSGLAIADEIGRIQFMNPAMERFARLKSHEITDVEQLSIGMVESTDESFVAVWKAIIASRAARTDRYFSRFEDGKERVCLVRINALQVEGRNHPYYLISLRDITDLRNLENQIRRKHRMESIGMLAGGIAHDFNNILSAVLGYSEMALKELDSPEQIREDLGYVVSASRRASLLIQQILRFSRSESGPKVPVEIEPIITEALDLARSGVSERIEICTEFDEKCPQILADPTQLHQLLLNLITNAMHAIGERVGRIEIKAESFQVEADDPYLNPDLSAGEYLRVSVTDTGRGISRQNLDRIFDPFFTTKGPNEGTGLGLSNCHTMARAHSGAITVYSEEGRGSTFHVYFPAATGEKHVEHGSKPTEELPGGNEEILVVDDVESLARLTKRRLEACGYRVTMLTSPQEALKRVESHPQKFALVISDLAMPGMTGEDLAYKLNETAPSLPVVILSGYSRTMTAERLSENIKGFLAKPISNGELQRTVRSILDATKSE